jgi:hypothetical protein
MPFSRHEPIHVTVPGRPDDPRARCPDLPGIVVHHTPPLHPDDLAVIDGIPVTSVSRTLVDLGEVMDADELRGCFTRARAMGLLEVGALDASLARVEWRPSLAMVREIVDEFRNGR